MALDIRKLVRLADIGFNLMPATADGLKSVKRSGTYQRIRGSAYDPITGTTTPNTTTAPIQFLVGSYSRKEMDGQTIQMGDEPAVVKMSELNAAGIYDLSEDDRIQETGGTLREVVHYKLDPTEQYAQLQLRSLPNLESSSSS